MALVKCNGCGGEYQTVGADGQRYFHACPPLSVAELRDAIDAGTVRLSPADQQRLDQARHADVASPPKADELTREAFILGSIVVRRAGHRDENIDRAKAAAAETDSAAEGRDRDPTTLQKAPGAGVTVLERDDPV
ncbi:MAG TPA: hypothetical protein VGJ39_01205 [Vicinamibacterales bacterium]|jgi:hypothetical protein